MKEIKFNSLHELYQRLLPALRTKVKELKLNNILNITEADIWNYLRYNIWNKKSNLSLDIMVDDILNVQNNELIEYKNKK